MTVYLLNIICPFLNYLLLSLVLKAALEFPCGFVNPYVVLKIRSIECWKLKILCSCASGLVNKSAHILKRFVWWNNSEIQVFECQNSKVYKSFLVDFSVDTLFHLTNIWWYSTFVYTHHSTCGASVARALSFDRTGKVVNLHFQKEYDVIFLSSISAAIQLKELKSKEVL
jgi:hypothetical protein